MQTLKNNNIGLKFLLSTIAVVLLGTAQAQAPQGFISRLIEIKYSTELYLSQALKKENGKSQTAIDSTIAIYNTLRWKVDGLVYQLSAEMIARNSPALLRQLDNWSYREEIRAKGLIKHYVASIKEIEQLYKEVVMPAINPIQNRTLNLTTNVFYLLKDSYSIIKGLSDLKTRKVMALVELLDHARLLGPGEVGKMASSK